MKTRRLIQSILAQADLKIKYQDQTGYSVSVQASKSKLFQNVCLVRALEEVAKWLEVPKMNVRIDSWFPMLDGLCGTVSGHPDPNVGVKPHTVTSKVIGTRNGKVVTQSGTEYVLGVALDGKKETREEFLHKLTEV